MPKKKTKEEFIKEATEKHGDKYDYSKVHYVNRTWGVLAGSKWPFERTRLP